MPTNPVGQTVQLNGKNFQVVGVLKSKGSNGPQDQDDIVIAPIEAVQDALTGQSDSLGSIVVEAISSKATTSAQTEIEATLISTHKVTAETEDFRILNQASLLQASSDSNHTFTVLLGAVAAISLLVGGIGVMNIMLVTVTERTREIGIRKAIGARKANILGQFMVEAVLLSMLGGLLGVAAGLDRQPLRDHRDPARRAALLGHPRLRRRRRRRPLLRHLPRRPSRLAQTHRRPPLRVTHAS